MKIRFSVIAIGAMIIVGCQSATSFQSPLNTHDYGPQPEIDIAQIEAQVGQRLKDAESARYEFGEPVPAYCNEGLLSGGKVIWTGWALPFRVNAKNSFGAYTGFENRYARYSRDQLFDVSNPSPVGPFDFSPKLGTGCKLVK